MKGLFFPLMFLLSLIFFLAHTSDAVIQCRTVTQKAAPCVLFATGKQPKPSSPCCTGLQDLINMVKSVNDKKDICRCLKDSSKNLGIQDKFLSQIPKQCRINVDFPVSITTSCEKIH